jgi:predicted transcriptional regulator
VTRLGVFAEETQSLTVKKETKDQPSSGLMIDLNTSVIILSIGTVACGAVAFTAGTDLGRYSFFTLLIPLYTRLNREALLDNFTRGRIFEHIRMNPGQHYRAIRTYLGLSNGSLAYHLKVLEKEDYIQSRTDGMCKRFYPLGMKIAANQPNNIQELILENIYEQPFITQKQLAEDIGVDISTINYHVNIMAGAGVIKAEKFGRTKHYVVEAEIAEPS